jgi:tRNA(Ile)-lysidine synthase
MANEQFLNTIKKNNLIRKKEKVLLGISGGPDSIYLLYQFIGIRDEFKLNLTCVHFNHALREESGQEESFVKDLCKKLKVKCLSEKKNVGKFFDGDSLEQTARNLRFDFFLKCARERKAKKIALAHHKDDLIETVLMRLIRGSGLKGLRGFSVDSRYRSLQVVRPLIDTTKEEILIWLKKNKIDYCEDKSNFEDIFLRNRIRLKLLPMLKEINPAISQTIHTTAKTIAVDYEFIYEMAQKAFLSLKKRETRKKIYLDLKKIKALPPALFNNVIRIAIENLQGHTRRLEMRHIEEISDMARSRPLHSVVNIPNILVTKDDASLIIQSLLL